MLKSLSIINYAIINELEIDFHKGFSTITGETGAGKSIILGALSLILGNRADNAHIKNQDKKCVIEAVFNIKEYKLENLFQLNDLDYSENTIIRREINSQGKSRAFINDTPISLQALKEISSKLIDIHSQHENLLLNDEGFQLNVVDVFNDNIPLCSDFSIRYKKFKTAQKTLQVLEEKANDSKTQLDFLQFQFEQLNDAKLAPGEQEELEQEFQFLTHAVDIKSDLNNAVLALSEEEHNAINKLKFVLSTLDNVKKIYPNITELANRTQQIYIETKDINADIESIFNKIDVNPERLEKVNERLNTIYSLQKKFQCNSIVELISTKESIEKELMQIASFDNEIEKLNIEIALQEKEVNALAKQLNKRRKAGIPEIKSKIEDMCRLLGMPDITFEINLTQSEKITESGVDKIQFLFSANKKIQVQEITKIASGGELSRLMLSIKHLISSKTYLPTIIFDEIDNGISGNIADKMGSIMQHMASQMQVISITHLPQIAAKGEFHYIVYKQNSTKTVETDIKLLSENERIIEIAKMLSGEKLTNAAISNAKELLKHLHRQF
ncbi:MAG TPA: DNA repair protein RecN [Bacteroidales bacterium]|nr:MAG: DNA repair protein RecN [Bacteroidetes bacterium GWF2_33_38]OFY76544.1 MAG: DNA repair protein RecN [Bacteroidetes bacterium RIFOXYA12_FULL_33_9]OFY87519.1 MAG: DNA repair protein RecN [Bacteroidetes bacterium RIFOXYA2_FULL_33_7]HBF87271.1 DNA repair protein RecN [Bacteroidales bacterium]